jgi:hypothetical protein
MSSPDTVRSTALDLAAAEELTTWARPAFRVGETIFAVLHADLLILRGERAMRAGPLTHDSRRRPDPHWGRDGWMATPLAEVSDQEVPTSRSDAHELASGAER